MSFSQGMDEDDQQMAPNNGLVDEMTAWNYHNEVSVAVERAHFL